MKKLPLIFMILFVLAINNTSCLNLRSQSKRISYYALDSRSPKVEGLSPLPFTLKILPFSSIKPYNTRRIIYKEGRFNLDSYAYHRWIAPPGDMVSQIIIRDFRESGLFKAIISGNVPLPSSFYLEGTVEDFLHSGMKEEGRAILKVNIILFKKKGLNPDIIFQKTYSASTPCPETMPEDIARAMSSSMEVISRDILMDIYKIIKAKKDN